jgi:hypothetical protein
MILYFYLNEKDPFYTKILKYNFKKKQFLYHQLFMRHDIKHFKQNQQKITIIFEKNQSRCF